jgi:hypothetical protein
MFPCAFMIGTAYNNIQEDTKMGRFRAAATVAARYEKGVLGLPPSCMVLSNSERRSAWCSRRWWYAYGNELATESSSAMRFGSHTHDLLEHVYQWWADTDLPYPHDALDVCPRCDGGGCDSCDNSGLGPLQAMCARLNASDLPGGEETPEEHVQRLRDVMEGYLRRYGREPSKRFKVLGAEIAIAAPVISPTTGQPYRSQVPVVETPTGWRVASAADKGAEVRNVLLPWYQLLRLDAVEQDRRTGDLWVREFKTSISPQSYGRDLALDTQIPGYLRGLAYAAQRGLIGDPSNRVAGFTYDVLGSSAHRHPKRLKSGKLSTDSRQRVPSWNMDAVLSDPEERPQYTDEQWQALKDLREHFAQAVDPVLYHREWGTVSPDLQHRYELELYADATRLANMRRAVCRAGDDPEAVALAFPRVPLCRSPGGWCAFKSICINDSEAGREAYTQRQPVHWLHSSALTAQNNPKQEDSTCLF